MCKKVMPANIESLPEELLFQIFLHLPADFLYDRAKFVCRSWSRIIRSEAFVEAQIRRSTYGLLLSSYCKSHAVYVTATQGRVETSELSYKSKTSIIASCNGFALEALHEERYLSLHVINPATKQSFVLPSVSLIDKLVPKDGIRIAYSTASMKYKVTLLYVVTDCSLPLRQRGRLIILTLGVDKAWRNIKNHHLPRYDISHFFQPLLSTEGFVHWGGERCVFTLNVDTEIITMAEVPHTPQHHHYRYYYLSAGRYLSMLATRENLSWEIWEMKPETGEWRNLMVSIELGDQKWRLLQQFASTSSDILLPLGWVKYLEVLAFGFSGKGHTCICYNLVTQEINTIELPDPCEKFQAFLHRNSLVKFKSRVSLVEDT